MKFRVRMMTYLEAKRHAPKAVEDFDTILPEDDIFMSSKTASGQMPCLLKYNILSSCIITKRELDIKTFTLEEAKELISRLEAAYGPLFYIEDQVL